jgi:adenylate cyclase
MERRLVAIMAADVVGYSRLMADDEAGTLSSLKRQRREIFDPKITKHKGRVVKVMGDGMLVEFGSVVEAIQCAIEVQNAISVQATQGGHEPILVHRMGINLGDVAIEGDDIYGDGVNIAARLQELAQAGGIAISDDTYRQVCDRLDVICHDLGEQQLKNIPRPVRVWEWRCDKPPPARLKDVAPALPDRPSIVILPFRNLTGNAEDDYLADGLRIDIQNALVKISGLFIIATGSALPFRGNTARAASRRLGVRYVLNGSVRRVGNRVRIALDLTDDSSQQIVWAESFDRTIDDVFQLMDEITSQVLTAMNVKLVAGEAARVWHKTLKDLNSLEAFYKGVFLFFRMTRDAMNDARQQFEIVVRNHPEVAVGPTWIALTHWFDFQRGWGSSMERSKDLAREWAERAAPMEDTDGQAHTVLSHVYLLDRQFDAALAAGRDAVMNRPNCTHANGFYGNVLHYCSEQQKAIHHVSLAIRRSPIHPSLFDDILAAAYRAAGDQAGAIKAATDAIATNPNDLMGRLILASVYVRVGKQDLAAAMVEDVRRIEPTFSLEKFAKGQPFRDPDLLGQFIGDLTTAGFPR